MRYPNEMQFIFRQGDSYRWIDPVKEGVASGRFLLPDGRDRALHALRTHVFYHGTVCHCGNILKTSEICHVEGVNAKFCQSCAEEHADSMTPKGKVIGGKVSLEAVVNQLVEAGKILDFVQKADGLSEAGKVALAERLLS